MNKTLTLEDEAIELILVLLHAHRDILDRLVRSYSKEPTKADVRTAVELQLTQETIKTLEEP